MEPHHPGSPQGQATGHQTQTQTQTSEPVSLTFGWVFQGPVQLQVWRMERTGSPMGHRVRTGRSRSLPSCSQLPFCLEQRVRAESGPEECPEGGKELGGQPLGGLEMPASGRLGAWESQMGGTHTLLIYSHTHPLLTSGGLAWPCQLVEAVLPFCFPSPPAPPSFLLLRPEPHLPVFRTFRGVG